MGTGASPLRHGTRAAVAAVLLAIALFCAACSGGADGADGTGADREPIPLRVGVTKAMDTVPLRLAVDRGVFERAGLAVELVEEPTQRRTLRALAAGEVDVAFAGNVALFQAAATGTDLRLQGEAYIAGPNSMALVTLTGVGYDDPGGKASPVIAVDPDDALGELTTRSRLATEGIDPARIRFRHLTFDAMMTALRDHEVDAAWLTEPRISRAQKEFGATIVTDTARGAMLHFPLSSYAALRAFAEDNGEALARFRAALGEAQRMAADLALVRKVLPHYASVDSTSAALVSLGSYPTSLSSVRLQRVADLMHDSGMLGERVDVGSMMPTDPPPGS